MPTFHGKRAATSSTRSHKKARAESPSYKGSPPGNGDKMNGEKPSGWTDFNDDLHIYQPSGPVKGCAKVEVQLWK